MDEDVELFVDVLVDVDGEEVAGILSYLSSFKNLKDPYRMAAFFKTLKVPSIIVYSWRSSY